MSTRFVITLVVFCGVISVVRSKAGDNTGPSINCFTCSNYKDCLAQDEINIGTECLVGKNSCLTIQGPGEKLSKWCAYNNIQSTFSKDGTVVGETYHWCDYDLCNKGDYATGKSARDQESSAVTLNISTMTALFLMIGLKITVV